MDSIQVYYRHDEVELMLSMQKIYMEQRHYISNKNTRTTATFIDNIFSNTVSDNVKSGIISNKSINDYLYLFYSKIIHISEIWYTT